MSLFFRQILILRHYVNYIEEKQDKSSIFLSSSVHTQAGVDIKILRDTPAPTSFYHVVALPSAAARSLKWSSSLPLADNGGVPTKTKTGVTVIRRAPNPYDRRRQQRGAKLIARHPIHFGTSVVALPSAAARSLKSSSSSSIGGSALPQAVILIWWWRQRFHRRKWRFHNRTAFTIGGKWGRRSSSSSFKASNGEIRSKVKASLPVIENHSP